MCEVKTSSDRVKKNLFKKSLTCSQKKGFFGGKNFPEARKLFFFLGETSKFKIDDNFELNFFRNFRILIEKNICS